MTFSGLGCSVIDYLYTNINFSDFKIKPYLSKQPFDGGLNPGGLVFKEEIESYTGLKISDFIKKITNNQNPNAYNLGGPAIVALINSAQLLYNLPIKVQYYGFIGNDKSANLIQNIIKKTPLIYSNYKSIKGTTPFTYVLSDPDYDNGNGERMFISHMGVLNNYTVYDIPDHFYNNRIVFLGATALLPGIHDNLSAILKKAKQNNCLNIVTTVYDFRNSRKNQKSRLPMGDSDINYQNMDLLITDHEEAIQLSGCNNISDAINFFIDKKVPTFIITHGSNPVHIYSNGELFKKTGSITLPVAECVKLLLKKESATGRDTTGCGDNFAGGVLASIAYQLKYLKQNKIDILTACAWGIASGGFACFYTGGTYVEKNSGEKKEKIKNILNEYKCQVIKSIKINHIDFNKS